MNEFDSIRQHLVFLIQDEPNKTETLYNSEEFTQQDETTMNKAAQSVVQPPAASAMTYTDVESDGLRVLGDFCLQKSADLAVKGWTKVETLRPVFRLSFVLQQVCQQNQRLTFYFTLFPKVPSGLQLLL